MIRGGMVLRMSNWAEDVEMSKRGTWGKKGKETVRNSKER